MKEEQAVQKPLTFTKQSHPTATTGCCGANYMALCVQGSQYDTPHAHGVANRAHNTRRQPVLVSIATVPIEHRSSSSSSAGPPAQPEVTAGTEPSDAHRYWLTIFSKYVKEMTCKWYQVSSAH